MNWPTLLLLMPVPVAMIVGYFRLRRATRLLDEKFERAGEFRANLHSYWESNGRDQAAYTEMVRQSVSFQRDLGTLGVMAYKPAGADYMLKNYQIINLISELQRMIPLRTMLSSLDPAGEIAQLLDDTAVRHIGAMEGREKALRRRIRNPLELLREGGSWIFSGPVAILAAFGILSTRAATFVARSRIARLLGGVVSLLTFVSAIVSLVVGWEAFVRIIENLFTGLSK